jgi:hypothetical protein
MPKTTYTAGFQELRKAFKKYEALQAKVWKERQKQQRSELKHRRTEEKGFKDTARQREDFIKRESRLKERERVKDTRARHDDKQDRDSRGRFLGKQRQEEQKHVKSMGSKLRNLALFAGGGILGFALGYSLKGYQNAIGARKAQGPQIGTGMTTRQLRKGSSKYGYNVTERIGLAGQMARATGASGSATLQHATRATGMDPGEAAGYMGVMRAGGTQFNAAGGGAGSKQFGRMISMGMQSGLERARLPEFFKGVTSLMQTQQAISAGDVGGGGIAKLAAALGKNGPTGFQGTRGMNMMAKMQQSILNPQGGNKAFMQQAFGFGTRGATFMEARMKQQKGLGDEGENIPAILDEVIRQHGYKAGGSVEANSQAILRTESALGIGTEQADNILKMRVDGKLSKEELKKISIQSKSTEDLQREANIQMAKAGAGLATIAGLFDKSVKQGEEDFKMWTAIEKAQAEMAKFVMPLIKVALEAMVTLLTEIRDLIMKIPGVARDTKDTFSGPDAATLEKRHASIQATKRAWMAETDPDKKAALERRMERQAAKLYSAAAVQRDVGSLVGPRGSAAAIDTDLHQSAGPKARARDAQKIGLMGPARRAFMAAAGIDPNTTDPQILANINWNVERATELGRKEKDQIAETFKHAKRLGRKWRATRDAMKKRESAAGAKRSGSATPTPSAGSAAGAVVTPPTEGDKTIDVNVKFTGLPAGNNLTNGPPTSSGARETSQTP